MIRTSVCIALVASLAACGKGNPFTPDATSGDEPNAGHVYAEDMNDALTMNKFRYDAAKDQLVINNLPFDGAKGRYDLNANKPLDGKFAVYESRRLPNRSTKYYAVFRRADSGNAQVVAVGTNRYTDYGFGGASAQRLDNNVSMPSEGEYVFTGEYAAVRIRGGGLNEQYVTGDVHIDLDIKDFDKKGAVEGVITDRKLYRRNGTLIGSLDNFVSMATASIDFKDSVTTKSTATLVEYGTRETLATGDWKGVFAGPDGKELAGIVVLESRGTPGTDGSFRETGVFLTKD